jgi:hypothetical protein
MAYNSRTRKVIKCRKINTKHHLMSKKDFMKRDSYAKALKYNLDFIRNGGLHSAFSTPK